ncbi:fumarylacetoacetate hydrolase family protein [Sphingomonas sp. RT2P30]|uniref:fumarylacetoacetate hydrolase family protein n=1 Tax=Parasphingomonas halimpatiens TaxID=3096162 RepID=UPI002FC97C5B
MTIEINATHDPAVTSWVASANGDTDFPLQNLPFGLFRTAASGARGGVALGDCIIDLPRLAETGLLDGDALAAARAGSHDTLLPLLAASPAAVNALRAKIFALFRDGSAHRAALEPVLVAMDEAELLMPMKPAAFTDFCTSYEHISRMGGGGVPKLPALSLPVAYNGRASSVRASGTPVVRPMGQFEAPAGSNDVHWGPEPMLDFELEFGAWLRAGNDLGVPVNVAEAEALLFGCCLVNDWSARGIQFFEMILGPHLGKSFLTTISPWIVTMEALAPFRVAARGRPDAEPAVPAYLDDRTDRTHGAIAATLTADLATAAGASQRIVETELADLYWTLAQMAAHQASNGAPLEPGDLIATGTVSGAADTARACLAEIMLRGGSPIALPDGSTRNMLEDGDTLTIRGRAHAAGYRPIGFGDCSGTVVPARNGTETDA